MKTVLLFSGGIDSFTAFIEEYPALQPVYFHLGHKYESQELGVIRALTRELLKIGMVLDVDHILDVKLPLEDEQSHIPYRNLVLATMAAAYYPEANRILLGALRGESSRDKSPKFFSATSRLLSYTENRTVKIVAPYQRLTKTQVVARYLTMYPAREGLNLLRMTRSCYNPSVPLQYKGCGRCMACFRRWVAMTNNGISENYQSNPWEWEEVQSQNWRKWWRNLRAATVMQWPHIIANNLDAYKAMKGLL